MSTCIYCKAEDAERIGGVALCSACRARFTEACGGGPTAGNPSVLPSLAAGHREPPRGVRPQSLARERYEQAWRDKERLR